MSQTALQSKSLQLSTPIQFLKGVGPHLASLLAKKGVYTAYDLLVDFPVRYIDKRLVTVISALEVGVKQVVSGKVLDVTTFMMGRSRKRAVEVIISDGHGKLKLLFLNGSESWYRKKFLEGKEYTVFGDVKKYGSSLVMFHPEAEIQTESDDELSSAKIVPVYSLTEGLSQNQMRKIIGLNLEALLERVKDDARAVRDGEVSIPLIQAYRYLHQPERDVDIEELNAHKTPYHMRIIYDEFFYLQLGLKFRGTYETRHPSFIMTPPFPLFEKACQLLPFTLTDDQNKVIEEIKNDFLAHKPMNRMVQGDVGSGKTMVAFLTALLAIQSGYQVALMAPTEILAEQHFKNLRRYEESLDIKVALLTGQLGAKQKKVVREDLEQGLTNLVIGTHALLTEDITFRELGYIIIDEQHRFGVEQRAKLKQLNRKEDERVPHVLVMSATPIPRSLSLCLYGDMDLSLIKSLPKGRKPIKTKIVRENRRVQMYEFIRREIAKGRQIYFVYPLIEESEKSDLKDATTMYNSLCQVFSESKVELIHGRLKAQEKESIMGRFKNHECHVLVSTTVIEVGVDVPNASVMVVEHAERFGLSQLHQLRGRVGRGAEESFCFLMASYAQSDESKFRLSVMEKTNDGFVVAEEDLKLRGPGDMFGTRQSGLPDFRLAHLTRDYHLLEIARKRAEVILKSDPLLAHPENQLLKEIMTQRWAQKLDRMSS